MLVFILIKHLYSYYYRNYSYYSHLYVLNFINDSINTDFSKSSFAESTAHKKNPTTNL